MTYEVDLGPECSSRISSRRVLWAVGTDQDVSISAGAFLSLRRGSVVRDGSRSDTGFRNGSDSAPLAPKAGFV